YHRRDETDYCVYTHYELLRSTPGDCHRHVSGVNCARQVRWERAPDRIGVGRRGGGAQAGGSSSTCVVVPAAECRLFPSGYYGSGSSLYRAGGMDCRDSDTLVVSTISGDGTAKCDRGQEGK